MSDGSVSLTSAILSSNTAQAGSGFGYGGYGRRRLRLQVSGGTVIVGTAALSSNTAQGGDCTPARTVTPATATGAPWR